MLALLVTPIKAKSRRDAGQEGMDRSIPPPGEPGQSLVSLLVATEGTTR